MTFHDPAEFIFDSMTFHDFQWFHDCVATLSILRSFKSKDPQIYINLFKTYVRPLVEYNTPTWNPHLISDIRSVENVQRKFTKRLCQKLNIKFDNYQHRIELLNIDSLEIRRVKFDLILMYKMHRNLLDLQYTSFFTNHQSVSTYDLRGHSLRLNIPRYSGSSVRENFFSFRILSTWNRLPDNIINSFNLSTFKILLNKFDLRSIYINKIWKAYIAVVYLYFSYSCHLLCWTSIC